MAEARRVAEERQHLVAHDAHDLLVRRETRQHFDIDGAIAHAIDERLDDAKIDVGLEQREPDLPERGLDRLLGQASLTAKRGKDVLKPVPPRLNMSHCFCNRFKRNSYVVNPCRTVSLRRPRACAELSLGS